MNSVLQTLCYTEMFKEVNKTKVPSHIPLKPRTPSFSSHNANMRGMKAGTAGNQGYVRKRPGPRSVTCLQDGLRSGKKDFAPSRIINRLQGGDVRILLARVGDKTQGQKRRSPSRPTLCCS